MGGPRVLVLGTGRKKKEETDAELPLLIIFLLVPELQETFVEGFVEREWSDRCRVATLIIISFFGYYRTSKKLFWKEKGVTDAGLPLSIIRSIIFFWVPRYI